MEYIGLILFVIGIFLLMISSYKFGKKNYDINVQLKPDVENIIKTEIRNFLEEHRPIKKDCQHNWETIKTGNITSEGNAIGVYYHLKCKNCGDMKKENFRAD